MKNKSTRNKSKFRTLVNMIISVVKKNAKMFDNFNKVSHKRLISKLQSFGLNQFIISWITDFLDSMKYRVKVTQDGMTSLVESHRVVS